MGRKAAQAYAALDLEVLGWNRSGRGIDGIEVLAGTDGLLALAERADVLINLLPLTRDTRGILGAALFACMRHDSMLINAGRGGHLVDDELLAALDLDRPGHAALDVFDPEPLPAEHPFWGHPKIRITPHCAGLTTPDEAAALAVESYRRVQSGGPPLGVVDRIRGY